MAVLFVQDIGQIGVQHRLKTQGAQVTLQDPLEQNWKLTTKQDLTEYYWISGIQKVSMSNFGDVTPLWTTSISWFKKMAPLLQINWKRMLVDVILLEPFRSFIKKHIYFREENHPSQVFSSQPCLAMQGENNQPAPGEKASALLLKILSMHPWWHSEWPSWKISHSQIARVITCFFSIDRY